MIAAGWDDDSIINEAMSESKDIQSIVASSRLPYQLPASVPSHGQNDTQSDTKLTKSVSGLVTALEGLPGESFWMGGVIEDEVKEFEKRLQGENQKIELQTVPIEKTIYEKHKKWSNNKLWPFLHGMDKIANQITHAMSKKEWQKCWESYKEVNQVYAESIKKQLSKKDKNAIIWIQDYHLFLVPKFLKQLAENPLKISYSIGFFLHIPFPPVEKFEKLPNYREILDGMLGYDSIGFHTRKYRDNFLKCCEKHEGCKFDTPTDDSYELQLDREGRKVTVQVVPAGIVYETFSEQSKGEFSEKFPEDLKDWVEECTMNQHKKLLIGVDRIDYTKGLFKKVDAFQKLLEKRDLSHEVFFLQIAVPCRTTEPKYKKLRKKLEKRVRKFEDQSKIRLHLENLSQQDLSVLYKKADVALVTPLIDGLNLVALEYIACQTDEPGVLILSENTGAAEYIYDDDDDLKVDPYDKQKMAEAMYKAINMESNVRREWMKKLKNRVQGKLTAERWIQLSLKPLREKRVEHIAKL